jgi:hypothetical protein
MTGGEHDEGSVDVDVGRSMSFGHNKSKWCARSTNAEQLIYVANINGIIFLPPNSRRIGGANHFALQNDLLHAEAI